jgi:hypothetical protein
MKVSKTQPLVHKKEIRLGILGLVEGNGHPYSWSAIFNGFDAEAMKKCPYSIIPQYLEKEPKENFGIPGAKITHIWTDDPKDARLVAKASLIPNIVSKSEDVIGEVDAVIIAADNNHAERCRPFVEAGLPVFVDKPMVDDEDELRIFSKWINEGRAILSSSAMRYAKEFKPYHQTKELGSLRFASITTPKSWERYGIHALEAIYPIFGPGFISARNSGSKDRNIVHFKHQSGADIAAIAINDMNGLAVLNLHGTTGYISTAFQDTFFAFKSQLVDYVNYLQTGLRPFPYSETEELMKMIIAGIKSREEGGREVVLNSNYSKTKELRLCHP